jgi:MOSC domain-containing protein YiiM
LIAGVGVEGDAHAGATVQHRYVKRRDPQRSNLRQVHLMHRELFDRLRERGFSIDPGELGENITTNGIDLLHLGCGDVLAIGEVRLRVTGLRKPCVQIDRFQPGLLRELIGDGSEKNFLSGVMSVVESGGIVRPGNDVVVLPNATSFQALAVV